MNQRTRDYQDRVSPMLSDQSNDSSNTCEERQEIETLISEEALLFAQYLRNEKLEWIPRIVNLDNFPN